MKIFRKITSALIAFMLLFSLTFTAFAQDGGDCVYAQEIIALFAAEFADGYASDIKEQYVHYSDAQQDIPDYVVVRIGAGDPAFSYGVYGEYVVRENYWYPPFAIGHYVYIPEDNELLTLREAWDNKVSGIEDAFENGSFAERIGDVDGNGTLNVKDATTIQKRIADIITRYPVEDEIAGFCEGGTVLRYISDFNRDGVTNIKDATAIQKYIAGIDVEYGVIEPEEQERVICFDIPEEWQGEEILASYWGDDDFAGVPAAETAYDEALGMYTLKVPIEAQMIVFFCEAGYPSEELQIPNKMECIADLTGILSDDESMVWYTYEWR